MAMEEERFMELFRQLPEQDKNSTLDFMEYLVSRQTPNQSHNKTERDLHLNEMMNFLNSLSPKHFTSLLWMSRGMQLSLANNQDERDKLSQKWSHESFEFHQNINRIKEK